MHRRWQRRWCAQASGYTNSASAPSSASASLPSTALAALPDAPEPHRPARDARCPLSDASDFTPTHQRAPLRVVASPHPNPITGLLARRSRGGRWDALDHHSPGEGVTMAVQRSCRTLIIQLNHQDKRAIRGVSRRTRLVLSCTNVRSMEAMPMKKTAREKPTKHRVHRASVKAKAIAMMGGKCSRCGFDDVRALRFHHINPLRRTSRGLRKRDETSTESHRAVVRGDAKGLRLLCANAR